LLTVFNQSFCQSLYKCELRKSLKSMCSPRGIITRILCVSDAVFQILKQNIRQMCFYFKSAIRKSEIAWTQNSQSSKTMAPSGRKLYYTMFLFLVLSSGTFGYTYTHTHTFTIHCKISHSCLFKQQCKEPCDEHWK